MSKLLKPDDVAARLNVTKKTVYVWLQQGKLKGIRVGALWRIDKKDLQAFIEQGKRGS